MKFGQIALASTHNASLPGGAPHLLIVLFRISDFMVQPGPRVAPVSIGCGA
jgi:hypothetical protein